MNDVAVDAGESMHSAGRAARPAAVQLGISEGSAKRFVAVDQRLGLGAQLTKISA